MRPSLTCPKPIPRGPAGGARPTALALYLLLEGADHLQELLVVEIEHLEREDLVAQKRPHPLELRLELRFS